MGMGGMTAMSGGFSSGMGGGGFLSSQPPPSAQPIASGGFTNVQNQNPSYKASKKSSTSKHKGPQG